MSVDSATPGTWIERRVKHRGTAVCLIAAAMAGAVVVGLHWAGTAWELRRAELAGHGMDGIPAVGYWPAIGPVLLVGGGLLGAVVFAAPLARRLSWMTAALLLGLAGLYLVEVWLIGVVATGRTGDGVAFRMALQGVAFLTYALLPPSALVAILGAVTALQRNVAALVRSPGSPSRAMSRPGSDTMSPSVPSEVPGAADTTSDEGVSKNGDDAHWREGFELDRERQRSLVPGGLGICLSGGGIRSATFALGALQALQSRDSLEPTTTKAGARTELSRARYLTAVSGGAYTAGAFLLTVSSSRHRADGGPEGGSGPTFDTAFHPGSPEFDHLRKHSSYLADSLREWVTAVLVLLRGAVIGAVLFLALPAHVMGRWVGHLYHLVGREADLEHPWEPEWGAVAAVLVVVALGLAAWLVSMSATVPEPVRRWSTHCAAWSCVVVAVLVVLGAVIPIVAWASTVPISERTQVATGALRGTGLGAFGVALAAIGLASRQRANVLNAVRGVATTWARRMGDLGRRVAQWLAVLTGLSLILAVYVLLFGYSIRSTAGLGLDHRTTVTVGNPAGWTFPAWADNFAITIALTAILLLIYFLVDETATGLHPFYRHRLATAFAVRRVRNGKRDEARPFDRYERTCLEEYTHEGAGGPQVIFCASAHCSDPERTPPGRHVLPFTFSHDSIGGPDVGWCSPASLRPEPVRSPLAWLRQRCDRISPCLAADLTVLGAMAVSGAAFASASGSGKVPANIILSLTNARLGSWIPNPKLVSECGPWYSARPPGRRRLSYLVREIFALYPDDFPMLFVTDGAHYEGLGLVELLRHRCREIYCFDASDDTEAVARTIGLAITLAHDELGVRITLDEPDRAKPPGTEGTGERTTGGLAGRLAETPIITGRIRYPDSDPYPAGESSSGHREGVIVIGRAVLTEGTPWEIQRHAVAHPLFPQDATGDQWFDDKKFNAYTGLGRHVGGLAVDAMVGARRRLHGEAEYRLGVLLLEQGEREEGRSWLSRAAENGHTEAAYRLAESLRDDDKPEAAKQWWELAAAAGHKDAMDQLRQVSGGAAAAKP